MSNKRLFYMLLFTGIGLLFTLIMQPISVYHFSEYIAVLFPKGIIALEERNLLFIIQALMLLIILPVYIMTFIFSWRYRAGNTKATYDPDLVDSHVLEYIWWGIPLVMTCIVGAITYVKTFELDPYKKLNTKDKELTIQVVALQWKWLFFYPEEKIATVNYLQIPKDRQIHFEITADAPMNSFWIPHLAGQIYAMPKMKTELHLMADKEGDYRGSSANLSGEGFAGMYFMTKVTSEDDYRKWVESSQSSGGNFDSKEYEKLAMPSQNNSPKTYKLTDMNLFNHIIEKYMQPQKEIAAKYKEE